MTSYIGSKTKAMHGMRAAAFLCCLSFFAVAPGLAAKPAKPNRGPSFELIDQHGRKVSEADLKGRPTVLHFGFTNCPVVCPTTLFEIAGRLRELGPLAGAINFVFVSVDPERDTAAVLKDYIASFDDRIIGLTGAPQGVRALADGLGATFSRRRRADGGYDVAHTIFAYLLDRDWNRSGLLYIGPGAGPEKVMKKLRALIADGQSR